MNMDIEEYTNKLKLTQMTPSERESANGTYVTNVFNPSSSAKPPFFVEMFESDVNRYQNKLRYAQSMARNLDPIIASYILEELDKVPMDNEKHSYLQYYRIAAIVETILWTLCGPRGRRIIYTWCVNSIILIQVLIRLGTRGAPIVPVGSSISNEVDKLNITKHGYRQDPTKKHYRQKLMIYPMLI